MRPVIQNWEKKIPLSSVYNIFEIYCLSGLPESGAVAYGYDFPLRLIWVRVDGASAGSFATVSSLGTPHQIVRAI